MEASTEEALQLFLEATAFADAGAVMTDLDGTAVHEWEGRIVIPEKVAFALKQLSDQGRPAIINSLRFPLNVIRTFGREWHSITNAPLPMVSLNGRLTGNLVEESGGDIVFRELEAFPVSGDEIATVWGQSPNCSMTRCRISSCSSIPATGPGVR